MIGASLVLMLAMRSNHIVGTDIHLEYVYFQSTAKELFWSMPKGHESYLACLSISLLPTIYQSLLGIYGESIYKVLYPLIFSFIPLTVYVLFTKHLGRLHAFLISFFFISQPAFFYLCEAARQGIAVLFFAIAMLVFFDDEIPPLQRKILLLIFIPSVIVSHYSTAYVFFIILFLCWVILLVRRRNIATNNPITNLQIPRVRLSSITPTLVVLFAALIFVWYAQVTDTAFSAGITFFENTFSNLNSFLVQELEPQQTTLTPLGIGIDDTPGRIVFIIGTVVRILMLLGIIALIAKSISKA